MRIDVEVLAEICDRKDIGRLRLFGSFARGEETAESDIDLIADFVRRRSLLELVRIEVWRPALRAPRPDLRRGRPSRRSYGYALGTAPVSQPIEALHLTPRFSRRSRAPDVTFLCRVELFRRTANLARS